MFDAEGPEVSSVAGEESRQRLVSQLRGQLQAHRQSTARLIREGESGSSVGQACASFYDRLLTRLFRDAEARQGVQQRVQLGAVGTYGRCTLSPLSDLDVRLLCENAGGVARLADELLYPLWDCGLDIGHQVTTIEGATDLAQDDLPTACSLLDYRTISGSQSLGQQLKEEAQRKVFSGASLAGFVSRIETRTARRHGRFGQSVYLLEPNLKSGAGGLRDLDVIQWLAQAYFSAGSFSELVGHGVLVSEEAQRLAVAREFLLRLRNALHVSVTRRSDQLTYQRQDELAAFLGYGASGSAAERFMRDYYCYARVIAHTCEMMLSRCRPRSQSRVRLGIGLGMAMGSGTVWLESASEQLAQEPSQALRVYVEAVERELRVSQATREAIARAVMDEGFALRLREDPKAIRHFVQLVCVARSTKLSSGSVLTDLHDVGLLVAMLPEFQPVVGRVHRDAYHVFTVDIHSIFALDYVQSLRRGDRSQEHRLATRVAGEVTRIRVLCLAALLHDIGKAEGGEGHSERGARVAAEILQRLNVSERESRAVQKLILLHLRMYHVATRSDVSDPEVVRSFAYHVGNAECLRELFVLTVADVCTTSPASMSDWKRQVLDDLFRSTLRFLTSRTEQRKVRSLSRVRDSALRLCSTEREAGFVRQFLDEAPERYWRSTHSAVIFEHARFALSAESEARVAVGRRRGEYAELWVTAPDRTGLLRMICGSLREGRLSVLRADIHSFEDKQGRARCFDLIWVKGLFRTGRPKEVAQCIENALRKRLAAPHTRPALPPPLAEEIAGVDVPVAPQVHIDNRTSGKDTILEVVAQDAPSLLYRLADALERLNISVTSAKINTEGHKVVDVLYVRGESGGKLSWEEGDRVREHLLASLAPLPAVKEERPVPLAMPVA